MPTKRKMDQYEKWLAALPIFQNRYAMKFKSRNEFLVWLQLCLNTKMPAKMQLQIISRYG